MENQVWKLKCKLKRGHYNFVYLMEDTHFNNLHVSAYTSKDLVRINLVFVLHTRGKALYTYWKPIFIEFTYLLVLLHDDALCTVGISNIMLQAFISD